MKKIILLLLLSIATNLTAQKDILYFDAGWNKTTKAEAKFYRPIPLKKTGNLYQVKDYYITGSLQMEGYYSNIEKEELEGKVVWYYINGQKSEIRNYKKGILDGTSTYYNKEGFLRAEGIFKNNIRWTGRFFDAFSDGYVPEFKEGKKIAQVRYYNKSNQVAVKLVFVNDSTSINSSFARDGKKLGEMLYINQYPTDGVQYFWFETEVDNEILSVERYETYKNKAANGEKATFDRSGKLLAKGIKKEGAPYSGTFYNTNYNLRETYVLGKLEGEQITYSEKGEVIAKGINKDGKPYSGSFIDNQYLKHNDLKLRNYVKGSLEGEEISFTSKEKVISKGINKNNKPWEGEFVDDYLQITTYKNGQQEGKQTKYYTANFKIIIEYYHIHLGKKEGESVHFDKKGKQIAKGIYKNDIPFTGTFYDEYYNTLSSYKEGKKHGFFKQYDNKGKIIAQQEYDEGQISGLVKSDSYIEDKICECEYKKGKPFDGEVCESYSVNYYKNGKIVKKETYNRDDLKTLEEVITYTNEGLIAQNSTFFENKSYQLTYKNNKPFNGEEFSTYDRRLTTYTDGVKNGPFTEYTYEGVFIEGNYKDNMWEGTLTFEDRLHNKITTCIFKSGKPLDGTVISNYCITNYQNGLKTGPEACNTNLYFKKNNEYEIVYDSITQNYKNGQLNGKIQYFKNQNLVADGQYVNGNPREGTFFINKTFQNLYKGGKLVKSTYYFGMYKHVDIFENYLISKEITYKDNAIIYEGDFKNGNEYNGTFISIDNKEEPRSFTRTPYKNGKKQGKEHVINSIENKIEEVNTYDEGVILHKIKKFPFKGLDSITGIYKKGKPFSGHFHTLKGIIEKIEHYKKGKKTGYQYYYSTAGSLLKPVLDSINYVNGKPFDGIDIEVNKNYHKHFYKKGKRTQTDVYSMYYQGISDLPDYRVTPTATGFLTYKTNSDTFEKYNELSYTNAAKTEGKVEFFTEKEKGYLKFKNKELIDVHINFKVSNVTLNMYLEKPNVLLLDAKNQDITINIYPEFKLKTQPNYKDFLRFNNLFFKSDGVGYFYLDAKLISKCTLKKGNPYDGIIIRQYEDGKFKYSKYKEGKRMEKKKGLTKDELLNIINKY